MLRRHLSALAGELQQTVLVDGVFKTVRQPKFADGFHALQVGQHMLGLRWAGRLTQPDEAAALGAFADPQQSVECAPVMIGQRRGQRLVHPARAARERFAAYTLDDIERRHDDALLSQHFDQRLGQHDPTVGLLSQLAELVDEAPAIGNGERRQPQPCLQFRQVLVPGLRPLRVLRPDVGSTRNCRPTIASKGAGGSASVGRAKPG